MEDNREHPLRTSPREGEGVIPMGTYEDIGEGVKVNKDVSLLNIFIIVLQSI